MWGGNDMTHLEKIRAWLRTFPDFDILSAFQVDYTDQIPANGGIFPAGMQEIRRRAFILGDVEVTNRLNFGIYCVFEKAPGDDAGASFNADWVMDFQQWVQEQSVRGAAPVFGNIDTRSETIKAENGMLYASDAEGTATYMVQLSIQYKNLYEEV
jgi:hypothetical protein